MSLEVSIAALERVQFTNKLGPPYALTISAKRCALFNIDEGGAIALPGPTKVAAKGVIAP
jgi:hypothetical protein